MVHTFRFGLLSHSFFVWLAPELCASSVMTRMNGGHRMFVFGLIPLRFCQLAARLCVLYCLLWCKPCGSGGGALHGQLILLLVQLLCYVIGNNLCPSIYLSILPPVVVLCGG